ncbi:hypothetical protein EGW08_011690 [Elysia chlorotica]|uniref:MD-2-related lipid-recognition domain-containing protein n=1 Tax=Elysia chlorotica TaxID=188477 RepID=A0A3S1BH12_ELYCH|nr:hypothetical protein EGW08_011690 [Elysia chlorotica]
MLLSYPHTRRGAPSSNFFSRDILINKTRYCSTCTSCTQLCRESSKETSQLYTFIFEPTRGHAFSKQATTMKLFIFFTLTLLASAASETINYKDCPNGDYAHATSVRISPCPSQPCSFKHGETVNVEIDFSPRNSSDTLASKVYGIVAGIPVPFPLPNPDACKDSAITCPITEGQVLTYKSSFDVLPTYPKINVIVMWQLEAGKSNQACFTFPMSIV